MKIGEVDKVEVVGEVSNRLLKSAKMVGIWGDREGMIRTLWDNYKKNELENVLNENRKTEQDLENYKKGILSQDQYENGTTHCATHDTISKVTLCATNEFIKNTLPN